MTILVIISFAVLSLTAAMATKEQQKVCSDMSIELHPELGVYFLDESDVKQILFRTYKDSLLRKPIDQIPVAGIEEAIAQNPYVEQVHVFIDMNEQLHIDIVQKQPFIRIINKFGVHYYIDKNANKIPVNNKFTCRVPIVTGMIDEGYDKGGNAVSETMLEIHEVMKYIHEDPFLWAQTEQVEVKEDGVMHLIPKLGDHRIVLGQSDQVDEAFQKLRIFYREGMPFAGWDTYSTIDLSYKGQVVCTKKNVQ